ncbi:TPA: hypothetical protein I9Y37_001925 [Citrobacter freundii]|nr:hypothetical protein [Citrobacter freundii]HAT3963900.1 hypothetical protein [Citrobacter freundii]
MAEIKKEGGAVTKQEKGAKMFTHCTREEKIRFVWQAKAEGMTLEAWVVKHLTEVCDKAKTPKP